MVMPRSRSSGALSIESNDRNLMFGLCFDSTLVIAAVKVVLPWSMCPIVPTFTCGLLRSNFSLAMIPFLFLCRPLRGLKSLLFPYPALADWANLLRLASQAFHSRGRLCHPNQNLDPSARAHIRSHPLGMTILKAAPSPRLG